MKGRSHLLLRDPEDDKNPRKLKDKLSEKEKEIVKSDELINLLKNEVKDLKNQLTSNKEESKEHDKYADLLNNLYQKGIIDAEGNFLEED